MFLALLFFVIKKKKLPLFHSPKNCRVRPTPLNQSHLMNTNTQNKQTKHKKKTSKKILDQIETLNFKYFLGDGLCKPVALHSVVLLEAFTCAKCNLTGEAPPCCHSPIVWHLCSFFVQTNFTMLPSFTSSLVPPEMEIGNTL